MTAFPVAKLPPPRPYQTRTVDAVRDAWRAGKRRILIVLPTGGGKTQVATMIAQGGLARGRRALWLAHREELVEQGATSLRRLGVSVSTIQADRGVTVRDAPFTVASVQTLAARPDLVPDADIIFLDEAHHVVSKTWRSVVARYPRPELVVGLTATPERSDRTALGDLFDHLVVGATPKELTALGVLVPLRIQAPSEYVKDLSDDPVKVVVERCRRPDGSMRSTVVFTETVEAAKAQAAALVARGIRAACVDGAMRVDDRRRVLADFAVGRIDVLTNMMVLTEGWDAPIAECCVLARGCGSPSTYLQIVGRILRSRPGKTEAVLHDLRGVVWQLGRPEADRIYSLEGKAIRLVEKPRLRQCPACGSVHEADAFVGVSKSTCPSCGFTLPPMPRPVQRIRPRAMSEVGDVPLETAGVRRAYFDRLVAQAQAGGWKPGAVGMRFKARFGSWPPWPLPALRERVGGAA